MDGMTFVVVARLQDAQGPSSGVARFTLPSYAPLHNFDSYETTWIVALNRFHVSLRTVNTVTQVVPDTSALQGACRTGTTHVSKDLCEPATCDIVTSRPRSKSSTTSFEVSCYQDDTVTPRPRSKSLTTNFEASCDEDDTMVQLKDEPYEDRDRVQNTEDSQELHENYTICNAEDQDRSTDDGSDRSNNDDCHLARDGAVSRIGCKFTVIHNMTRNLLTCYSSQTR